MTDQKDTMPDEIYAGINHGHQIWSSADRECAYGIDQDTRYIRADKSMVRDILRANRMQAEKIRELKKERDLLAMGLNYYSSGVWSDLAYAFDAIELARKIVEGEK